MYNLTYLGHRVTLPWLDPRSNFDLDLSRSNYTWFDAPWRDKHDGIKIVALPLKLKILSSKNRFGKFWNFDPWWPQFWPEPKNDRNDFEMIFRELSNAVFRFVLRCAGAEIDGGGCSNTPPPSRSWKIQRPSRARDNGHTVKSYFEPEVFDHDEADNTKKRQHREATMGGECGMAGMATGQCHTNFLFFQCRCIDSPYTRCTKIKFGHTTFFLACSPMETTETWASTYMLIFATESWRYWFPLF